jgi:DNA-binding CsgD family transcriptional regulator
MAYELAEQGEKEKTFALLDSIAKKCPYRDVIIKTWETKAEMYKIAQQYDSAIYVANQLWDSGYNKSTVLLIKAQAFSYLGLKDSATIYAEKVLEITKSLFETNNALYILTHDDKNKDINQVRQASADRSDTQKLIEIRQGELSQSTQLLEQDLIYRSKYKTRVIYTILILAVVLAALFMIIQNIRKKRNQFIQEKKDSLYQLEQKNSLHSKRVQTMHAEIENRCNILLQSPDLKKELCWKEYKQMCRMVDQQFYLFASKLQKEELKEREVRLCLLVLLNLTHAQIAELMYVEENSVGKLKERAAKRLSTSRKNMRKKLLNMIVGEDL